ncbi:MAG TPA: molybdate ABC transporter substrate-binding protein [Methanomicrobiales archaeon]|nr:molybdate ABC transporter substrate-binding protein [Methanomicrobiales archaeon]
MTPRTVSLLTGIVCLVVLAAAITAGCTSGSGETGPVSTATTMPTPAAVATTAPAETTPAATVATTSTPAPTFSAPHGSLIVFTAASLSGASKTIGPSFTDAYPGHPVAFNLDGTQALKTQVENGAYADVFISASNSYTNALQAEGYFVNGTVKKLTTNYVILILPASNPAGIRTLADLARPGVKIAMEAKAVPAGTATLAVLGNLANSTYSHDWENATLANVVTYETSEPAVATKVSLGEVDAGFVYQSTYTAAPAGTYAAITIPKKDNYLQTYTIGILKESTDRNTAATFEQYMLSVVGQTILKNYGFTAP